MISKQRLQIEFKMQAVNNVVKLRQTIQLCRKQAQKSLVTLEISKVVQKKGSSLSMKFSLALNLSKKQNATPSKQNHKRQNPFLNPDPALFITQLGQRHNLLFNKFNIFQNHLLVVTKEYESQENPITLQDFKQSVLASSALDGLLFFNGGKLSGASQPHKHLQILPKQARSLPIFSEIHKFVEQKKIQDKGLLHQKTIMRFPHFGFKHGIIAIQSSENTAQLGAKIHEAYAKLSQSLKITSESGQSKKDYNLIACQGFVAIFLRKKQMAFEKLSVNSVGFLGSVLFKDSQTFHQFLQNEEINPFSILSDISQSENETQDATKK